MNKQKLQQIIEDDRPLTRDNIIDLGWTHFSKMESQHTLADIFVIRNYEVPQNVVYDLIDLFILWRNYGNKECEVLISYNSIYPGEKRSEVSIIDEDTDSWADAVIENLAELRILMELTEVNHFLEISKNH